MSKDLVSGSILHCLETASLGMPLEVWKTRMCVYRNENTIRSFCTIYNKGVGQFYAGFYAKLIESSSKGAVLLISKEHMIKFCNNLNINQTTSGFIGGAVGGISQSLVMTPCTFFITASIDKKINYREKLADIIKNGGFTTLYKGNCAMCLRQGTNWASRQGLTEWVRNLFIERKRKAERLRQTEGQVGLKNEVMHKGNNFHQSTPTKDTHSIGKQGDTPQDLSPTEELLCGVLGGALSVWNNPFDVIRVYMQNNANKNINLTFLQSFVNLYREGGILYLYKGVIPRCFLCIWQTLFMVTGIKILNKYY
ncbi:mitochondrial carrier protein, putative [Plasmodium knowlesi strain H]|uniref:Mitochondrial carrier protein, putative n=3 Tax=Plasmodium knowlesi TaxID=5850 RepID=A0A5K1TYB2_PLAKH|nr:citrate/oxoglutarate carrier protein, putative [Plasmodium knowlesi strain H]OTN63753.1 putative Mitochondrial carrier protein [Plasmodium knowlesi]CAA9991025.1 citrate/oxoglutarate carrier protein, putative [Plasmodium knowlesi strain H]SBO20701.1 mitochondrial carrier protein, putative [Plasmodium knowlesi strain H]SBO21139.1 mitochondrial carrier protein, putative [Plasmodium knowlesi strain H]VVS80499.1 citrate/oxoglutarate carrier protein, putative [Plasmodium knowlesi strain H]|eukprot:XP_002262307.1 mitochondrial carrier protein, putative [Plasmodium knowlesi strain H]